MSRLKQRRADTRPAPGVRNAFWALTAELLRYKRMLALALGGAILSALCFGAGIGMVVPILHLFFSNEATQGNPLRQIVDRYLGGADAPAWRQGLAADLNAWIPADPFYSFLLVMAVIGVLSVIGSVGRYVHELLTITATQRGAVDLRDRLFRSMVLAPVGKFDEEGGSGYASRIVVDVNVVMRGQLAVVSKAVAEVLKGFAAFGVALVLNWKLTLSTLLVGVVIFALLRSFGRTIRRASRRALKEQSAMLRALSEVFTALPVVKTNIAEGYERRRFRGLNRRLFVEQMRMRQARALASPVVETLGLLGVGAAAAIAAWWVFRQGLDPAQFLGVLLALAAAGTSLKPLTATQVQIKESEGAAVRVMEALGVESEPILLSLRRQRPTLPRHHRGVTFEDVSFSYPGASREALSGVHLHAPFGATVAIVGPNGSGKTTLLSLLPRLHDPTSGRVLIDGVDVREVNLRSLREQIAVVTQQTVLFEGTIADNIAYGRRHTPRKRIEEAAKAAYAHDFITAHPMGYDRELGERGEGLSGGQKQRISIARAVLRDPAILILDEATSQIDADSEAKINQALSELRAGRTTFIIAHRLSTVIDADMIVLMVDGCVSDVGTHDQLLDRSPVYRTLTRTQLHPPAA